MSGLRAELERLCTGAAVESRTAGVPLTRGLLDALWREGRYSEVLTVAHRALEVRDEVLTRLEACVGELHAAVERRAVAEERLAAADDFTGRVLALLDRVEGVLKAAHEDNERLRRQVVHLAHARVRAR